jgi:hypothetical protein
LLKKYLSRFKKTPRQSFSDDRVKLTVQERASEARALLKNQVFVEAFDELRNEALKMWEQSAYNDVEGRENIYRHIKALNQIKGRVESYINNALLDEKFKERQAR